MTIKKFPIHREKECCNLYLMGTSLNKLAKIFRVEKSSIKHLLRRNKLIPESLQTNEDQIKLPSQDDILKYSIFKDGSFDRNETIKNLYLNLFSIKEIALFFNLSPAQTRYILHKKNVKLKKRSPSNKIFKTKESRVELVRLFEGGSSVNEIALIKNVSRDAVLASLKEEGLEITRSTSKRKYQINSKFFKTIDSEYVAYFLGLMYADGNVCSKGGTYSCSISLIERDKYLLEKFRDLIQPKLSLHKRKMLSERHQQQYKLSFSSKEIALDLIRLGCFPKKSLKLKFPNETQVPRQFIWHFLRGYFDGDGCISLNKSFTSGSIKIIGSKNFIYEMQKFLLAFELKSSVYKITEKTFSLHIFGKERIKKIYHYFYENSSIKMKRKFEKFQILFPELSPT